MDTEKVEREGEGQLRTFFYRVEYDDRNRSGKRIVEYVAIDGQGEFDVRSNVAVGTTQRAGKRLYGGNIAPFSNVSATLLTDSELSAEDPLARNAKGQPMTIKEKCLDNKLVWEKR